MRWNVKPTDAEWRWNFALFPVRIHDQWIWLEWYRVRVAMLEYLPGASTKMICRSLNISGQSDPYEVKY